MCCCSSGIQTTESNGSKVPVLYDFHAIEIVRWFEEDNNNQKYSLQRYFPERLFLKPDEVVESAEEASEICKMVMRFR